MLFINNKYTRIYYSIISNAQLRILSKETYTETHHIIPKSIGGSNLIDNLAILTAREHFVCHWLLTKMVHGKHQELMIYALRMMNCTGKKQQRYKTLITSRVYAKLKAQFSIIHSNRIITDEVRHNMSVGQTGKKHSDATKAKFSKNRIGTTWSEESRQKMRGRVISEETRQKLRDRIVSDKQRAQVSATHKGKIVSEETKQKMREAYQRRKQDKS
jgi:hypothetical protein